MKKVVPFFENSSNNVRCLQACTKSVLKFYIPDSKLSDHDIDKGTGQIGGWSWLVSAVSLLVNQGIKAKLHSVFDYAALSKQGGKLSERNMDSREICLRETKWISGWHPFRS